MSERKYRRITRNDRMKIEALYNAKMSVRKIAEMLGFHYTAIYYELKKGFYMHRNSDWTETRKYSADKAQMHTEYEATAKGAQLKLGNDYEFINFVEKMIKKKYSPNAILGYIKRHNLVFKTQICRNTLYSYIDKGLFLHVTNKDLCRKGKKKPNKQHYVRAKRLSVGTSIDERPKEIEARCDFGHWEFDTVQGKRQKGEVLLVLTERKTRFEIIFKAKDKTAFSVVQFLDKLEKKHKKQFPKIFKTITVDNGSEFSYCEEMERSILYKGKKRTKFYYCHPYSSWERGSNENQNSFIRRFIPKGSKIENYTQKQIDEIAKFINSYPRELFDFKNSEQLFLEELEKIT